MKRFMKRVSSRLKEQRGISLLETVIALGILGLIGVGFMLSISSGTRAVQILDEHSQAEALARSQLDAVLDMTYNTACYPADNCYPVTVSTPPQYSIAVKAKDITNDMTADCVADGNCNTLQEVTVIVSRPAEGGGSRPVLAISTWRTQR